jgi:poly-gamma-glutamate synthesis protein (capsule biosynthesis protein)
MQGQDGQGARQQPARPAIDEARYARVFLAGDVMIGRGIDQALAHSVDPVLHEPWVRDARTYLSLAEQANGPVEAPLAPTAVWGDALRILRNWQPLVRIVNVETALTERGTPWPGKGIHYRTHPGNIDVLRAAEIDVCVLANNHVLDWGREGLADTITAFDAAGLCAIGAGMERADARCPAVRVLPDGGRLLVFAAATGSSGVPEDWDARGGRGGIWRLPDIGRDTARRVARIVHAAARAGDRVVFSLHWGENWGYAVSGDERRFARALIDDAGVDVVYGHSSHHPRPIEVYRGHPILYGCGDLLNDYEGIGGHASYRPDLVALYFIDLEPCSGRMQALHVVPLRIARFRLHQAPVTDADWLARRLALYGTRLESAEDSAVLRLVPH